MSDLFPKIRPKQRDDSAAPCANHIKNCILRYYRFNRSYQYISTELWEEDVVVSDAKTLVCIEVKVTWADYKREFKKDKYDEIRMQRVPLRFRQHEPNRRYFAAPYSLACKIADDISALQFGVLSVDHLGRVHVRRKAKPLHSRTVQEKSLLDIVARNSSELITMREKYRGGAQ